MSTQKNFNQNKNMPSLNCFITFHYLVIFSSKREIVVWRQLYSLNNSNKHLAITAFIAAPAMFYKLNSTSGNKERLLKWEDKQTGEKQPSEREILDWTWPAFVGFFIQNHSLYWFSQTYVKWKCWFNFSSLTKVPTDWKCWFFVTDGGSNWPFRC